MCFICGSIVFHLLLQSPNFSLLLRVVLGQLLWLPCWMRGGYAIRCLPLVPLRVFHFYQPSIQKSVLVLHFQNFLSHFVNFPLIFLKVFLGSACSFNLWLGFSHSAFHLLDKLGKLSVLLIFLLQCTHYFLIFNLQLLDHQVSLLELLFDYLKFLWVCKSVFGFNYFFELLSQSDALVHVNLNFDFGLVGPCILNVSLKQFNFISSCIEFELLVPNFSLEVNY